MTDISGPANRARSCLLLISIFRWVFFYIEDRVICCARSLRRRRIIWWGHNYQIIHCVVVMQVSDNDTISVMTKLKRKETSPWWVAKLLTSWASRVIDHYGNWVPLPYSSGIFLNVHHHEIFVNFSYQYLSKEGGPWWVAKCMTSYRSRLTDHHGN